MDARKNFSYGTVLTPPSPAASGTTLVLNSGHGARFPNPSTDGEYNIVIKPFREIPVSSNAEICRVTARSTDTLTIAREQEGSSARTILAGDEVFLSITKKTLDDIGMDSDANDVFLSPSKNLKIADDKDIKFASGAKIERDGGHLKLTPESGKETQIGINAKARAYLGTSQIDAGNLDKIELDTESYDPGNNFDTANNKFVAPITGYYQINAMIRISTTIVGHAVGFNIEKNGTPIVGKYTQTPTDDGDRPSVSDCVYLEKDDEITLTLACPGGDHLTVTAGSSVTFLSIHLLSV